MTIKNDETMWKGMKIFDIEDTDTEMFLKGLAGVLTEGGKNNDLLKRYRNCMDRLSELRPQYRQSVFKGIVESGLEDLESRIPTAECAMNGHQLTKWELVDSKKTEYVEDLTTRDGEEICKPWELPDAMKPFESEDGTRIYVMQESTVPRWERYCKHCGRLEFTYNDPEKVTEEKPLSVQEESIARRLRTMPRHDL